MSQASQKQGKPLLRISFVSLCVVLLLIGSTSIPSIGSFESRSAYAKNISVSSLFSSADGSTNITELGCCTVHAYDSQGSYSYSNQSVPDSDGNYASATVTGFALNPLSNGDPNYDYYIFDIYASVSSASYANWWVDSNGLNDPNGPSLVVYAQSCFSPNQTIYLPYFSPSTYIADNNGSTPETTSLEISFGPFSFGYSHTFTPPLAQTEPTNSATCYVSWNSAANTNANPPIASYGYDFAVGVKVPKGEAALINVFVEGNFYQPCGFLCGYHSDTVYFNLALALPIAFSAPPITTITSSPAGLGFVYVDGTPVATPAKFVWDEGNTHTITASSYVPGGPGSRYSFVSWSDGGPQSHDILAPSVATNFTAYFQLQDELNISASAGGTTDPPPNSYWYNSSQVAVVKALPQTGYALENWVLDGVDEGNASEISILMNKPHFLTEIFVPMPTITVSADTGGTIIVQSNAIDSGVPQLIPSGGSVTYGVPLGSNITLIAKPNTDYSFVQWTGSQSSQSTKFSLIVQGNMQESAIFVQNTSAVTSTSVSTSFSQQSSSGSVTTSATTSITAPAAPPQSSGTTGSPFQLSSPVSLASLAVVVITIAVISTALFLRRHT
jgi:hypothetical protein